MCANLSFLSATIWWKIILLSFCGAKYEQRVKQQQIMTGFYLADLELLCLC